MMAMRPALAAACLAFASACAPAPLVERVYDGHVIEGRSIEPVAYAAFLRGAIAEASGDERGALAAYREAARTDSVAPEIWTRVGAALCALDPRDRRADEAFARALAFDERYSGLWVAKAKCAVGRRDDAAVLEAARRASELDPSADGANALLARAGRTVRDPTTRDALVALTETAGDRVAAWDALASWAESRGDVALWARALETLVKIAPARRDAVALAAEELAGAGEIGEARALAAAAADADDRPLSEERHPLAARLAVDEALTQGDANAVRLRATRARVGLEEVAARALLAGRRNLASEVASAVARADPAAQGIRLVLAACDGGDLVGTAFEVRRHGTRASGATLVAFGAAAVHAISPEDAHATLAAVVHDPIAAGDDRVIRPAVELASRGALDADALPADGLVELAVLRGEASPEGFSLPDRALDLRHRYLALSLADPRSSRTRELGDRLAKVASSDPIVAAALGLVELATGAPIDSASPGSLLRRDPGDPLLAAVALRLAKKTGDSDVVVRARAALSALGGRELREGEDQKKSGRTF
jgi:hypothetical protein